MNTANQIKRQFEGKWISDLYPQWKPLTRDRVAYLLQAARSRRASNVRHSDHIFLLRDCRYLIAPR